MFIFIIFTYCIIFLTNISELSCEPHKPTLLLNALDNEGYQGALWFAESVRMYTNDCIGRILIFTSNDIIDNTKHSNIQPIEIIHYNITKSLEDKSIGKLQKYPEYVTYIIESWKYAIYHHKQDENIFISISFLESSIPVATSSFMNLYDDFLDIKTQNIMYDLMLLDKTKYLSSISDWHDISLVMFDVQSQSFQKWFHSFVDVYMFHADRNAFTMLEPRPALLEASIRYKGHIRIGYISNTDICSTTRSFSQLFDMGARDLLRQYAKSVNQDNSTKTCSWSQKQIELLRDPSGDDPLGTSNHHKHPHYESRCHHLSVYKISKLMTSKEESLSDSTNIKPSNFHLSAIEYYCGNNDKSQDELMTRDINNCLVLSKTSGWKAREHDPLRDFGLWAGVGTEREASIREKPIKLMWQGIQKLRNATDRTPRSFCWDTGKEDSEDLSRSKIEYNLSYSFPFQHHQYHTLSQFKTKYNVAIMTASGFDWATINNRMYNSISKMYYAKRHGYKYIQKVSDEVISFFPNDIFKGLACENAHSDYFRGIMTKPLMMLDVMYSHLEVDWLLWTDDDVYFNSGWAYMPLDVYLDEVPQDKVFVLANYRSTFSNVLFVRNNFQGRKLMRDWVAIVMSGHIQCHGFDQAGLSLLIANRFIDDPQFHYIHPLNYSCFYTKDDPNSGCNDNGKWSCDFRIEKVLYLAGFKSRAAQFFGAKISSFTKGCANDFVKDFYIITETKSRPRLQCGLCSGENEIDSTGNWDGPLGGGNDLLRPGCINGWFMNHKADYLMYEIYLKPSGCKKIADVVPLCDPLNRFISVSYEDYMKTMHSLGRHLISMTDGYAYDLENSHFCKITNIAMIKWQYEKTYMSQYADYIKIISNYTESEWTKEYRSFDGGYGRTPCALKHNACDKGENEAGLELRRPLPPIPEDQHAFFFENRENLCDACRKVEVNDFPYLKSALDCRSIEEENFEIAKNDINMD